MDVSETSPEERFHSNVVDLAELVHELVQMVSDRGFQIIAPNLIQFAVVVLKNSSASKLIRTFIKYSHDHWNEVKRKNESFFDEHAMTIFKDLPVDTKNINAFKQLFTLKDTNNRPVISQDDKEAIWLFFDTLIKISIKYIHSNRHPILVHRITKQTLSPEKHSLIIDATMASQWEMKYQVEFFPEINLEEQASIWNVRLDFKCPEA